MAISKGKKGWTVSAEEKKVSASEIGKKNKPSSPAQPTKEEVNARTQKEKQETLLAFVFDTVDDFTAAAKKMERFKETPIDRVRYGVFLAIPEAQEVNKGDFAKHYKVHPATLSEWRLRDDVLAVRDYIMKAYLRSKTPKVLKNLFAAASEQNVFGGANTAAIKLFLQYAEDFTEKSQTDLNVAGGLTVQFANVAASPFIQPEDSKPVKKEAEKPVTTKPKTTKKTVAKKKPTKASE